MKTYLGSLNILNAPPVSLKRDVSELHPDTPLAINKNLELDRLDSELFPILVTGVSCWPFLTLAFDCDTQKKENNVFSITKSFRKQLKNSGGRNIIGPLTRISLRPYKSMCQKLQSKKECKEISDFLKKKFDGNPSFFTSYDREKRWKSAFKKSNGKQANAFIKAHKANNDNSIFGIVSQLLSEDPQTYDKTLWYGAFCYAFLRCLFGSFDKNEGESFSYGDYSITWKKQLLKIMGDDKSPIPSIIKKTPKYKELLNKIETHDSKPPLAEITKQYRKDERPVLSGLRLGIFYRLYFNPTPLAIKKYLESKTV